MCPATWSSMAAHACGKIAPVRYVYAFDEDSSGGRELLGGKGIGLAEMTALGVPVPAGFTITTDACRAYMAAGHTLPDGLEAEIAEHIARARGQGGQALRRSRRPAARLRALGRGGLDARDDGHDPQPGPERRRGAGAGEDDREPALRLRLVPEADPDVRGGRGRRRGLPLRAGARRPEVAPRREAGRRALGRRPRGADRDLQAGVRRGDRRRLPAGRPRPARAGRPRRLRLVELAARAGLPAHLRDPRRHRHGRQRRPDGLRQQGRHLGHRCLLHARPVHGRERPLRRVPPERAGRGRRGRDPHARADRADGRAAAGVVRRAARDDRAPRGALPRHAGHRVHRRGRQALPAPDPYGQAHGRGGAEGGGEHGR